MKKIFLAAISIVAFCSNAFSDMIPITLKSVPYCAKIINVDSFPEITFILGTEYTIADKNNYIIKSGDCLDQIGKYNKSKVFAAHDKFLKTIDLQKLNCFENINVLPANIEINALTTTYVNEESDITSVEENYKILGFSDNKIIIYKVNTISKFNSEKSDSIKIYDVPEYTNLNNAFTYTSVEPLKPLQSLIFPSPSQEILNFQIFDPKTGNVKVEIFDMNGKLLFSDLYFKKSESLISTIDIKNYKKGFYTLKYSFGNFAESRLFLKK